MKKTLIAVVALVSTVAFADDASKKKDQSAQEPPPSTGSMGNGEAPMGNGAMPKPQFSQSMIQDWPAVSQKAAQDTVAKYGSPKEMTASMLVWENTGPFKRTVVYKEEIEHQFPVPHKDVIEQVIDYKVPVDKLDDLAQLDGSLIFDRTKGELTARSDSEANNIAMLNSADQLVKNKMTVTKARDSLAKHASQAQTGAQAPEPKLQIARVTQPTGDPDRPAPGMGQ